MSEAITPLAGNSADTALRITDAGMRGMITLRGDLEDPALRAVVAELTGAAFPGTRAITFADDAALAWMSPDELLVLVPYADCPAAVARIAAALASTHHLVADVSDARTVIHLRGSGLREVLAKGAPVDLRASSFGPGEIRRTRLGQVAVAFWMTDPVAAELVCFRSVGPFVFDWLVSVSAPGSLPQHL